MKHRQVFRVENSGGEGPYQTGAVGRYYETMTSERHPSPHFNKAPIFGCYFPDSEDSQGYVCGFDSLLKLVDWFGTLRFSNKGKKPIEAKPFSRLANMGHHVAVFKVCRSFDLIPADDRIQCVFNRDSEHTIYVGNFPLTMARHLAMMPAKKREAMLKEL